MTVPANDCVVSVRSIDITYLYNVNEDVKIPCYVSLLLVCMLSTKITQLKKHPLLSGIISFCRRHVLLVGSPYGGGGVSALHGCCCGSGGGLVCARLANGSTERGCGSVAVVRERLAEVADVFGFVELWSRRGGYNVVRERLTGVAGVFDCVVLWSRRGGCGAHSTPVPGAVWGGRSRVVV
jgi:hypothetical protein